MQPYKHAALDYFRAGFAPLPLPAKSKQLTVRGWTGHEGLWPSGADVYEWTESVPDDANIALRLPRGVVGIDVDDYGSKRGGLTLDLLIEKWGALPPTIRSTARPGGRAGIYLYRVPDGLWWPGKLGDAIDVVVFQYRYMVVHPSWNPDANAQYRWIPDDAYGYTVDGRDGSMARIPTVDELPWLPDAWVEGITQGQEYALERKGDLPFGGAGDWIDSHDREDNPCRHMRNNMSEAVEAFKHGNRHDTLLSTTLRPIRDADAGHAGLRKALGAVRRAFEDATADPTRGSARDDRALEAEWNRAIEGAIRRVVASPIGASSCPCYDNEDLLALTGGVVRCDPPIPLRPNDPIGSPPSPTGKRLSIRDRMLTVPQLGSLPPLEPLIVDTLERGTLIMLAGDSGTYKSFTAIDWAACIASGAPWFGREVPKPAPALYVCGEGSSGMSKRIPAWQASRIGDISDSFVTLPMAVNLGNAPAVAELGEIIREDGFGFVVFDTLNRCSTGLEENSASDMGRVIDAMSYLRDCNPGTSICVVHHSGKDGTKERGSSALFDGMDTVYFSIGGHGEPVEMFRRKRKDGDERDEHTFRLRLIAGTQSGVLDPVKPGDAFEGRSNADKTYEVFRNVYYVISGRVTRSELRDHMMTDHRMSKSSFNYALGQLISDGRFKMHAKGSSEIIELGPNGHPPRLDQ